MTQRFERLMEPGQIGPVKTRNRIIKTANGTSYVDPDQTCGDRMIAYYERLAKGGVGFLTVESCGTEYPLGIQHVHYQPDGSYQGVQLHFDDDRFIPGFQRLTDAVHKAGCPVSIQFQHAGAWNPTGLLPRDMSIRDIKCASAMTEEELPGPDFLPCRAMTKQELEDQIDLWAAAAERAWKAGFDACEINHATAHQGNTFLSRIWNKRDDEYGPQSYENRTRFMRNVITEAKRRCGPGFAVTTIINAAEYNHPLATTLEEGAEMARLICEVADGINVRGERYGHRGGVLQPDRLMYPEPPYDLPKDLDWSRRGDGATVPLAEAVKARVSRCRSGPPAASTRRWGEKYLREGKLDFVGMTRFLLADPEYPNKVREGRLEDVRPCLGCLHCFEMRNRNKKLECRVNGTLGREIMPEYQATPAATKKKVLVVGGGPSGMEAARVAAERGHDVVLYEKDARGWAAWCRCRPSSRTARRPSSELRQVRRRGSWSKAGVDHPQGHRGHRRRGAPRRSRTPSSWRRAPCIPGWTCPATTAASSSAPIRSTRCSTSGSRSSSRSTCRSSPTCGCRWGGAW